mgnify:CR=1 FL=1|jgi:cation transport protein ChaC|tara:strand:+ start:753 stop:1298 length:546 start_codon:yes stop_codon:yes gene_type:complete
MTSCADPIWIFGYGSLIWRVEFPFADKRPARIRGWKRRFWQGSTDHRGVPGAPGRVVTLLPDEVGCCSGMAYRLDASSQEQVLQQLDVREKGGYQRQSIELDLTDSRRVTGLTYIATPTNGNYLGPAPLHAIAEQICRSRGPSGANSEYLFRLARALNELGSEDTHVAALVELVEAKTAQQ